MNSGRDATHRIDSNTNQPAGAGRKRVVAMAKAYRYAVFPAWPIDGPGRPLRATRLTDDLASARKSAARITRRFQAAMAPHGGTSGWWKVVEWGRVDRELRWGWMVDTLPPL